MSQIRLGIRKFEWSKWFGREYRIEYYYWDTNKEQVVKKVDEVNEGEYDNTNEVNDYDEDDVVNSYCLIDATLREVKFAIASTNLVDDPQVYFTDTANSPSCVKACTIQFNSPPLVVVHESSSGADDGLVSIYASTDDGPLEYSLDDTNWQSSSTFSNLSPGSYTAYVRDSNPDQTCKIDINFEIRGAYGVLYKHEFDEDVEGGAGITIEIGFEGYTGATNTVQYSDGDTPAIIRLFEGNVVKGTEAILRLLDLSDFTYHDLFTTQSRDYKVEIKRGSDTIFVGYIIPETYEEEYLDPPYVVSISASDGLGYLKNYPFTDFGEAVTGRKSMMYVVTTILKKLNLDLRINEAINIYEDSMDSANSDGVLEQTYVNTSLYYDNDGEPYDCYTVLEIVLGMFDDVHIYQAEGKWNIVNRNLQGSSYRRRLYDENGVYISNELYDPVKQNLQCVRSADILRIFNNYKQIDVNYNAQTIANYIIDGKFENWNSETELAFWNLSGSATLEEYSEGNEQGVAFTGTYPSSFDQASYIESTPVNLISDSTTRLRLAFNFYIDADNHAEEIDDVFIYYSLKVGNYYFEFTEGSSRDGEWTTENKIHQIKPKRDGLNSWASVTVNLPPLVQGCPATAFQGNVELTLWQAVHTGNNTAVARTVFANAKLYPVSEKTTNRVNYDKRTSTRTPKRDVITITTATTPIELQNFRGFYEIEKGAIAQERSLYHGDGPDVNALAALSLSDGTQTETWNRKGVSENLSIIEIYIQNFLNRHYYPNQKLDIAFRAVLDPTHTIIEDNQPSKKFTIQDAEYDVKTRIWACTLSELQDTQRSITIERIDRLVTDETPAYASNFIKGSEIPNKPDLADLEPNSVVITDDSGTQTTVTGSEGDVLTITNGRATFQASSGTQLTQEQVEDYAAALFDHANHTGVSVNYNDANDRVELTVTSGATDELVKVDSGATAGYIGVAASDGVIRSDSSILWTDDGNYVTLQVNPETIRDTAGTLFDHGSHTNISATIDDANNRVELSITDEVIQDKAAALFDHSNHTGITVNYDDANNEIDLAVSDEWVEDVIGGLLVEGTNITLNYDDGANTLTISSSDTQRTDEEIMDIVGPMLDHANHSGFVATYNDANDRIDLSPDNEYFADSVIWPLLNHSNHLAIDPFYSDGLDQIRINLDVSATKGLMAALTAHSNHTGLSGGYNGGSEQVLLTLDTEWIQDNVVAPMFDHANHSGATVSYNDANDRLEITVTGGGGGFSQEEIEDFAGAMFDHSNHTNITAVYDDSNGEVQLSITDEVIQDQVAAVVDNVQHTGIDSTYDDVNGIVTFDIVDEYIEDLVDNLLVAGTNISLNYDDVAGTLTISSTGSGFTQEEIEDFVGAMLDHGNHSGVTATYDDANDRIDLTVTGGGGSLTQEQVQDFVAPLFNHPGHFGITASYDDANDEIELTVEPEYIQDQVYNLLNHANHVGVDVFYDDANNELDLTAAKVAVKSGDVPDYLGGTRSDGVLRFSPDFTYTDNVSHVFIDLNTEAIYDMIGFYVANGFNTGIDVTHNDASNNVTFDLDSEWIMDNVVAPLFNHANHTNITVVYDDANNQIELTGQSGGGGQLTGEQVQDFAAQLLNHGNHTNLSATYDDAADEVRLTANQRTQEEIEDFAAAMFTHGGHNNASVSYDDFAGILTITATNTQLTNEQVQDIVGPMFDHLSHIGLTANYSDAGGEVDLTIDNEYLDDRVGQLLNHGFHSGATVNYDDNNARIEITVTSTGLNEEQVEDIAAAMFDHSAHTNVTAVYNDSLDRIELTVPVYTGWNLQANSGASTQISDGEAVNFQSGTGINVSRSGNTITIAATGGGSVSGTQDYIPIFTSSSTLGDSKMKQTTANGQTFIHLEGTELLIKGSAGLDAQDFLFLVERDSDLTDVFMVREDGEVLLGDIPTSSNKDEDILTVDALGFVHRSTPDLPSWNTLSITSGNWTADESIQHTKDERVNLLYLRGRGVISSSGAGNEVLGTLPAGSRPDRDMVFDAKAFFDVDTSTQNVRLELLIQSSGEIGLNGGATGLGTNVRVNLNGIVIPL